MPTEQIGNEGRPLPVLKGHDSPGRLERLLRAGKFAVTGEIAPPDSAAPEEVYERARIFDGYVDAINATDGSGGELSYVQCRRVFHY